ncbi:hypothetical protein HN592_05535 [Candidatus Woesearchaeota archaeon]|mgnify:CR=1 FL=1|jgi:hypothetical protein|nr:hypothetical protein [Candidatus Woesearchaeota archaeon]MBT4367944.1 hypothetical protein [Candidatus Woesearchaeota archaeon]MBT4712432.1 hypothetical protein [Candidatus Woesearchaeota archaeon]MBT6639344.1 hypothetical protein [Candidatus Woesearchaeota archaeon]MBT7133517.1 hypothetical protein [Candidatus Woesearchaeota archaeon]
MNGVQYVSLLSSSHSGSTLLSMLMAANPKIRSFGDTYHNSNKVVCSCNTTVNRCKFRNEINEKLKKKGFKFDWKNPLYPHLLFDKFKPAFVRKTKLFRLYVNLPNFLKKIIYNKKIKLECNFVDSLKEINDFSLYFDGSKSIVRFETLKQFDKNIKLIHLIKSPYSFINSCIKHKKTNLSRCLEGWLTYNNTVREYKKELKHNYLLIKYEELASNPTKVLKKIYKFIDIPAFIPDNIEKEKMHVLGSEIRFKLNDISDIQNKNKDPKKVLTPNMIRYVNNKIKDIFWIKQLFPKVE